MLNREEIKKVITDYVAANPDPDPSYCPKVLLYKKATSKDVGKYQKFLDTTNGFIYNSYENLHPDCSYYRGYTATDLYLAIPFRSYGTAYYCKKLPGQDILEFATIIIDTSNIDKTTNINVRKWEYDWVRIFLQYKDMQPYNSFGEPFKTDKNGKYYNHYVKNILLGKFDYGNYNIELTDTALADMGMFMEHVADKSALSIKPSDYSRYRFIRDYYTKCLRPSHKIEISEAEMKELNSLSLQSLNTIKDLPSTAVKFIKERSSFMSSGYTRKITKFGGVFVDDLKEKGTAFRILTRDVRDVKLEDIIAKATILTNIEQEAIGVPFLNQYQLLIISPDGKKKLYRCEEDDKGNITYTKLKPLISYFSYFLESWSRENTAIFNPEAITDPALINTLEQAKAMVPYMVKLRRVADLHNEDGRLFINLLMNKNVAALADKPAFCATAILKGPTDTLRIYSKFTDVEKIPSVSNLKAKLGFNEYQLNMIEKEQKTIPDNRAYHSTYEYPIAPSLQQLQRIYITEDISSWDDDTTEKRTAALAFLFREARATRAELDSIIPLAAERIYWTYKGISEHNQQLLKKLIDVLSGLANDMEKKEYLSNYFNTVNALGSILTRKATVSMSSAHTELEVRIEVQNKLLTVMDSAKMIFDNYNNLIRMAQAPDPFDPSTYTWS